MASRRMISADIFEDEFIGSLNYFERLLWIGLFSAVADDQGRMIDSPALIRARVFLYDQAVNDAQVETTLLKLSQHGKIARYIGGSKHLIQVIKWWEYQTPTWAMPSKYPAPEGWQDRAKYHAPENKVITLDWDKKGGYIDGYIPGVHSGIEERRGDDGERREEDDEGSKQPLSEFSARSAFIANLLHVPEYNGGAENWNFGLEQLKKIGATDEHISKAYSSLTTNKRKTYTLVGPQSLVTATSNVMQQEEGQRASVRADDLPEFTGRTS